MKTRAVLSLAEKTLSERGNEPLKRAKAWVSLDNVCAIKSTNICVVNTLKNFEGNESDDNIELIKKLGWDSKVNLSVNYLKIVLEFLKSCGIENEEGVTIRFNSRENYPICFEVNENALGKTQIIIAPRVGVD